MKDLKAYDSRMVKSFLDKGQKYDNKACRRRFFPNRFIEECNCSNPTYGSYSVSMQIENDCQDSEAKKFYTLTNESLNPERLCPTECDEVEYEAYATSSTFPSNIYRDLIRKRYPTEELHSLIVFKIQKAVFGFTLKTFILKLFKY